MMNSYNSIEAEQNDLRAFKKYLDEKIADESDESGLRNAVNGIKNLST